MTRDLPASGGLDGEAVVGGHPARLEPSGNGLWPLAADPGHLGLGGGSHGVDGAEDCAHRHRSKPHVDSRVNCLFVDADERSSHHQQMIDAAAYQARFDAMIAASGAANRSAFAHLLGVSKQTVQNWYERDLAIPQGRRRLILEKTGFSIDWVNEGEGPRVVTEPAAHCFVSQSQPARLDPAMVAEAYQSIRLVYEATGKDYDIETEPDLFVKVYEGLLAVNNRPSTVEEASFQRTTDDRPQGADDGGEEQVGRAGSTHQGQSA